MFSNPLQTFHNFHCFFMSNFSFHSNFFLSSQSKSLFSFPSKPKKEEDRASYFLLLSEVIRSDKQAQLVSSLNQDVFSLFKNNIKEIIPSVVSSWTELTTSLCLSHNNTFSLSLFSHPFSKTLQIPHRRQILTLLLWCFCLLSFCFFHPFLPRQIFSKQPPNTPPVSSL